ncbi:Phosphinothricin N-acetyltransferase [Mariniflexile rhizosphaerae]|uniref:GNAT family N-acetyltransferase n=1 Tax=unclassified Mariniflexile TaxID=2643887 RepID=UPI000CA80698|nr:GNAT family N-acetyltransferase [Mariniflexile sp. TRM1-10]AXP79236.1 Phosphinothricin N-acetyltransferase [Mariniflexile sp. TRM1-10]PLB17716.1 MAG: Phosphinothricin N-acetyltransferase [Flavobacteriaceae bacterium FS1-H7996/R]
MIRPVTVADAQQLVAIYNYYVIHSIVTLDLVPFSAQDFEEKISTISSQFPFIVYEENDEILGYAYANTFRTKPAYNKTVELTIYLKHNTLGKQIGKKMYSELIQQLKEENYHVLIGGLTLPNDASVKLHEGFGFEKVAHFKEVGYKFDKWHDVGFWQLTTN